MEMRPRIKNKHTQTLEKVAACNFLKKGNVPNKTTQSEAGQHVELDWNDFHLQYNKIESKEQEKNWKLYFLNDNHWKLGKRFSAAARLFNGTERKEPLRSII